MYLSILKLSKNDNNAGENNLVAICNHISQLLMVRGELSYQILTPLIHINAMLYKKVQGHLANNRHLSSNQNSSSNYK